MRVVTAIGVGLVYLAPACADESDDRGASLPPVEVYIYREDAGERSQQNLVSYLRVDSLCADTPLRLVNVTAQGDLVQSRVRPESNDNNDGGYTAPYWNEYSDGPDITTSFTCETFDSFWSGTASVGE